MIWFKKEEEIVYCYLCGDKAVSCSLCKDCFDLSRIVNRNPWRTKRTSDGEKIFRLREREHIDAKSYIGLRNAFLVKVGDEVNDEFKSLNKKYGVEK